MKIGKLKNILNRYTVDLLAFISGGTYTGLILAVNNPTHGDYTYFEKEPVNFLYGIERWNNWSSRLLLENFVNLFSKNLLAWSIITIFLGGVLFWSLCRILKIKHKYQLLILLGLFLMINPLTLASAGIFATTICYLWPMSLFLFSISTILHPIKDQKIHQICKLLTFPTIIISVCNEQLAILSVIFFGSIVIYNFIKKQRTKSSIYSLLFMSILGIVNIFICPGSYVRKISETAKWWPNFENLNILEKIEIGTTTTFSRLFLTPEVLIIIFVVLTLILAYKKRNSLSFSLSLISNILLVLFFIPANDKSNIVPINPFFKIRNLAIHSSPDNILPKAYNLIIISIFLVVILMTLVSIIISFKKSKESLFLSFTVLSGLFISLAISLSPTIFASSTRTLFPFFVILASSNYILLSEILNNNFKKGDK